MKRQLAREISFVIIFEKSINGLSIEEIIENDTESRDIETDDYITEVVNGVFENIEQIDGIIKQNLKGWEISRLSKVTLALLRLAVFEIYFMDDIPEKVSVNEAVELCKKFATKDDAVYLNGVLASVIKGK